MEKNEIGQNCQIYLLWPSYKLTLKITTCTTSLAYRKSLSRDCARVQSQLESSVAFRLVFFPSLFRRRGGQPAHYVLFAVLGGSLPPLSCRTSLLLLLLLLLRRSSRSFARSLRSLVGRSGGRISRTPMFKMTRSEASAALLPIVVDDFANSVEEDGRLARSVRAQ